MKILFIKHIHMYVLKYIYVCVCVCVYSISFLRNSNHLMSIKPVHNLPRQQTSDINKYNER